MRIAFVQPYQFLPPRSGGQQACYQFCQSVSSLVTLVCVSTTNNELDELDADYSFPVVPLFRDIKIKYLNPFVAYRIYRYLRREQTTHLVLMQPYMGLILWPVARRLGIPLVVYALNIEHKRFASMGKWWSPLMRWLENVVYRRADAVFVISAEELGEARAEFDLTEANSLWVPHGINRTGSPSAQDHGRARQIVAERHGLAPDALWLTFYGSLNYPPNIDGLYRLLEEFMPLWDAQYPRPYHVLICGGGASSSLKEKLATAETQYPLHYLGFVDDLPTYIQAADFLVNAVIQGGGVKIKVMEALAWGTTVISTTSGARGILKEVCGQKLLVHDDGDWAGMVESIMRLAEEPWQPTPTRFYETYHSGAVAERVVQFLSQLSPR